MDNEKHMHQHSHMIPVAIFRTFLYNAQYLANRAITDRLLMEKP